MNRSLSAVVALLAAALAPLAAAADSPRNVILIIGDGFDDQHVTMGRNYLEGSSGELRLDQLPVRAAMQIETVGDQRQPVYVADSANTATTMATGVITQIGRIGTDPDDRDHQTIAEAAIAAGMRAGLVSTASITDATPAAFIAHVAHRSCQNPKSVLGGTYYGRRNHGCPQDARDNGGPGSIAEQIAESGLWVALGGGRKHFKQPLANKQQRDPTALATAKGFRVVDNMTELESIPAQQRVLGLLADNHLSVRWQGSGGRRAEDTTVVREATSGDVVAVQHPEVMACEPNPNYGATPSLQRLTEIALQRLSADNDKGFFLMIESASIDKQSHARNPCGSIGEVAQLEEALTTALAFAENHPETLVVVTADHAQAAQIIPEPSVAGDDLSASFSPGKVARIKTPEGSLMAINYATTVRSSAKHTGANVPLFANAEGAKLLPPYLRQRDLYQAMLNYLGLAQ